MKVWAGGGDKKWHPVPTCVVTGVLRPETMTPPIPHLKTQDKCSSAYVTVFVSFAVQNTSGKIGSSWISLSVVVPTKAEDAWLLFWVLWERDWSSKASSNSNSRERIQSWEYWMELVLLPRFPLAWIGIQWARMQSRCLCGFDVTSDGLVSCEKLGEERLYYT